MDLQLPGLDDAGGAAWERQWHPYDDYLNIHSSRMRRLEDEGLVLQDNVSLYPRYQAGGRVASVRIRGRLRCAYDVSVQVDKVLAIRYARDVPQVRTSRLAYHAWLTSASQDVLRYDTAHGEGLHCHVFDLTTGESALLAVSPDMVPTLDGFVRMACRRAADAVRG